MNSFWRRSRRTASLLRRWGSMLLGRSYWHVPQGLGSRFSPGELAGYFNDLTAKVQWNGLVDDHGLPVNEVDGKRIYFATTLFQKALGHWDLWLGSPEGGEEHRSAFLAIAQWAVETQDERGGGPCGRCWVWTTPRLIQP